MHSKLDELNTCVMLSHHSQDVQSNQLADMHLKKIIAELLVHQTPWDFIADRSRLVIPILRPPYMAEILVILSILDNFYTCQILAYAFSDMQTSGSMAESNVSKAS